MSRVPHHDVRSFGNSKNDIRSSHYYFMTKDKCNGLERTSIARKIFNSGIRRKITRVSKIQLTQVVWDQWLNGGFINADRVKNIKTSIL